MLITSATFRPATQEEVTHAKGNLLWRMVTRPLDIVTRIMGTWQYYRQMANPYAWDTPAPLKAFHYIKWHYGFAPERDFLTTCPAFFGTWQKICNQTIVKEFFRHNRQGELFDSSRSMYALCDVVKKAFPNSKITAEDFMFTCSAAKNQMYHQLILKLMNGLKLNEQIPFIQQAAEEILQNWETRSQKGEAIDAIVEPRYFTSKIISHYMFNISEGDKEIAESINFINYYIVLQVTRQKKEAKDDEKFMHSLQIFNREISTLLNKNDCIPLFENSNLTIEQKQAMAFIIFFGGQETTASLLTYVLFLLAKDKDLQREVQMKFSHHASLNPAEMTSFFNRMIREFTPAYGVGRLLKTDACLEYQIQGENKPRKHIFHKGETLVADIAKMAQQSTKIEDRNSWNPFGGGVHRCPGEKLATKEFEEFIKALSAYDIELVEEKDVHKRGSITLHFVGNLKIRLSRHS